MRLLLSLVCTVALAGCGHFQRTALPAGTTFSGKWWSSEYQLVLEQNGESLQGTGTFEGNPTTVEGRVQGNVAEIHWSNPKYRGEGELQLDAATGVLHGWFKNTYNYEWTVDATRDTYREDRATCLNKAELKACEAAFRVAYSDRQHSKDMRELDPKLSLAKCRGGDLEECGKVANAVPSGLWRVPPEDTLEASEKLCGPGHERECIRAGRPFPGMPESRLSDSTRRQLKSHVVSDALFQDFERDLVAKRAFEPTLSSLQILCGLPNRDRRACSLLTQWFSWQHPASNAFEPKLAFAYASEECDWLRDCGNLARLYATGVGVAADEAKAADILNRDCDFWTKVQAASGDTREAITTHVKASCDAAAGGVGPIKDAWKKILAERPPPEPKLK